MSSYAWENKTFTEHKNARSAKSGNIQVFPNEIL